MKTIAHHIFKKITGGLLRDSKKENIKGIIDSINNEIKNPRILPSIIKEYVKADEISDKDIEYILNIFTQQLLTSENITLCNLAYKSLTEILSAKSAIDIFAGSYDLIAMTDYITSPRQNNAKILLILKTFYMALKYDKITFIEALESEDIDIYLPYLEDNDCRAIAHSIIHRLLSKRKHTMIADFCDGHPDFVELVFKNFINVSKTVSYFETTELITLFAATPKGIEIIMREDRIFEKTIMLYWKSDNIESINDISELLKILMPRQSENDVKEFHKSLLYNMELLENVIPSDLSNILKMKFACNVFLIPMCKNPQYTIKDHINHMLLCIRKTVHNGLIITNFLNTLYGYNQGNYQEFLTISNHDLLQYLSIAKKEIDKCYTPEFSFKDSRMIWLWMGFAVQMASASMCLTSFLENFMTENIYILVADQIIRRSDKIMSRYRIISRQLLNWTIMEFLKHMEEIYKYNQKCVFGELKDVTTELLITCAKHNMDILIRRKAYEIMQLMDILPNAEDDFQDYIYSDLRIFFSILDKNGFIKQIPANINGNNLINKSVNQLEVLGMPVSGENTLLVRNLKEAYKLFTDITESINDGASMSINVLIENLSNHILSIKTERLKIKIMKDILMHDDKIGFIGFYELYISDIIEYIYDDNDSVNVAKRINISAED